MNTDAYKNTEPLAGYGEGLETNWMIRAKL